jgi:hypothetical protein
LATTLTLTAASNTSADPRWGTAAAVGAVGLAVGAAAATAAASSSYYNSGYYGSGYGSGYGAGYYDYAPGYAPGLAPGGAIGSSGPIYDAWGTQFPPPIRDDCRLSVANC